MMLSNWQMGAYGAYVWSSYALTLLGLAWVAWSARKSWRQALEHAQRRARAAALNTAESDV